MPRVVREERRAAPCCCRMSHGFRCVRGLPTPSSPPGSSRISRTPGEGWWNWHAWCVPAAGSPCSTPSGGPLWPHGTAGPVGRRSQGGAASHAAAGGHAAGGWTPTPTRTAVSWHWPCGRAERVLPPRRPAAASPGRFLGRPPVRHRAAAHARRGERAEPCQLVPVRVALDLGVLPGVVRALARRQEPYGTGPQTQGPAGQPAGERTRPCVPEGAQQRVVEQGETRSPHHRGEGRGYQEPMSARVASETARAPRSHPKCSTS